MIAQSKDLAFLFQQNMDESQKRVSVIVPVFNEEKTVASVVEALLAHGLIHEVICVNDGSTDQSQNILEGFGQKILLINLTQNQGKGSAMAEGIKRAKSEVIAFFDADLTNLSPDHITTLLAPILKNRAQIVLGVRVKRKHLPNMTSYLCGERAYIKKDLLPLLGKMASARFGVEVLLNEHFKKKKTRKVKLIGLRALYKYEKCNLSDAILEYILEAVEIAQELGEREVLSPEDSQIIAALSKEVDFNGLRKKIGQIKNKKIRRILERYILKYVKTATNWWQEF